MAALLDHVNIVTADVGATARFYVELLDLTIGANPLGTYPEMIEWLYDQNGRAIIHVNALGAFTPLGRAPKPGADTNALHHVAFECTDFDGYQARLEAAGRPFHFQDISPFGLKQLFVEDPNGVLIELNFRVSRDT